MQIKNSFNVPLPPDRAFATLLDVKAMAASVPGAELIESLDENRHKGRIHVRLGPIAMQFDGLLTIEDRDPAARTAHIKAQGNDTKGRGNANARTLFRVEPADGGSRVELETDLTLTGMAAQYGRASGVITALSTQIINTFASNLEARLAAEPAASTGAAGADGSAAPAVLADAPAAKPISAVGLLWRALLAWIGGLFGATRKA